MVPILPFLVLPLGFLWREPAYRAATATLAVVSLIPQMLDLLARSVRLILLGGAHGKVEVDFYRTVHKKNLTIVGTHEGGAAMCEDPHFPWTNPANMAHCLDLMQTGSLDVAPLISDRAGPEDAGKLYAEAEKNPNAHMARGACWEKAGNPDAAEAAYRQAIELSPKHVGSLNNLA